MSKDVSLPSSVGSSGGGDEDFDEFDLDDTGEDFEATLDEEEALDSQDYADELRDLEDEGEMSIEELRRRYGLPPDGTTQETSTSAVEGEADRVSEAGGSGYFDGSLDEELEEDDIDYAPVDPWKKEVRVDEDLYQASIPSPDCTSGTEYDENVDSLWTPTSEISDEKLDEFLKSVFTEKRNPSGFQALHTNPTQDNEDALCALLRHNYDALLAQQSSPFPEVNIPKLTTRGSSTPVWTEEEKTLFELALNTHGKDFVIIRQSEFSHRPMGELIEYYYSWKKTDRYHNYRKRHLQPEGNEEFTNSLMHHHHLTHDGHLDAQGNPIGHLVSDAAPLNDKIVAGEVWDAGDHVQVQGQ